MNTENRDCNCVNVAKKEKYVKRSVLLLLLSLSLPLHVQGLSCTYRTESKPTGQFVRGYSIDIYSSCPVDVELTSCGGFVQDGGGWVLTSVSPTTTGGDNNCVTRAMCVGTTSERCDNVRISSRAVCCGD